jgi:hypothetical protein
MRTALLTFRFSVVEYLFPRNEHFICSCGARPQSHTAPLGVCGLPPRGWTIVYCMSPVLSSMRIAPGNYNYETWMCLFADIT